jgi:hypothetical protein
VYAIISWSNPPPNALERLFKLEKELNDRFKIIPLLLPKIGLGKQRNLTLHYIFRSFKDVDYIIYMEEDVIIRDRCWLDILVKLMDVISSNIALVSLEPISLECLDLVSKVIRENYKLAVGFTCASGLYIIRANVLKEMISKGLETYSSFMYFFHEDKEFSLKLWLLGYKTASYRGLNYIHLGSTVKTQPLHRRYTRYIGPLMTIFINLSFRLMLCIIILRSLLTFLSYIKRGELILFLKAYLFMLKNLKHLIFHRLFRKKVFMNYTILERIFHKCVGSLQ